MLLMPPSAICNWLKPIVGVCDALRQHRLARSIPVGHGQARRVVAGIDDAQARGHFIDGLGLKVVGGLQIVLRL